MSHWGPCLAQLDRHAEAEAPLREALERLMSTEQTKGEHLRRVLTALADVCDHTNRPEEAAAWRARLNDLQPSTRPTVIPG
jgi:hypothetical protein